MSQNVFILEDQGVSVVNTVSVPVQSLKTVSSAVQLGHNISNLTLTSGKVSSFAPGMATVSFSAEHYRTSNPGSIDIKFTFSDGEIANQKFAVTIGKP